MPHGLPPIRGLGLTKLSNPDYFRRIRTGDVPFSAYFPALVAVTVCSVAPSMALGGHCDDTARNPTPQSAHY